MISSKRDQAFENPMPEDLPPEKRYWLIGNAIDGICCHPHRQKVQEAELLAYLESQFVADFNASRGEFDFTIYRATPRFRLRRLYGYYLQGPKRDMIARVSYMTADSLGSAVRRGRTFAFFGPPGIGRNRALLRFRLPGSRPRSRISNHRCANT